MTDKEKELCKHSKIGEEPTDCKRFNLKDGVTYEFDKLNKQNCIKFCKNYKKREGEQMTYSQINPTKVGGI